MKIALPVHDDRLSPVMDFSTKLSINTIDNGVVTGSAVHELNGTTLFDWITLIKSEDVDVIICGSISEDLRNEVERLQIGLFGNVCGPVEEVLKAYLQGNLKLKRYGLPGCRQAGKRWRRQNRFNR